MAIRLVKDTAYTAFFRVVRVAVPCPAADASEAVAQTESSARDRTGQQPPPGNLPNGRGAYPPSGRSDDSSLVFGSR